MAFNTVAGIAVSKCMTFLPDSKGLSVLEFGNQRFTVKDQYLTKIAMDLGVSFQEITSSNNRIECTKLFYNILGFDEYLAVDVNTKMNAIVMDLNQDFREKYEFTRRFSMVTNIGTGEHVFNQYQVMKNMHDATQVDGIMLNIMPFFPNINHGFYNFNPVLFRDIAYANGYQWCFFWLADMADFTIHSFDPTGEVCRERKTSRPFIIRLEDRIKKRGYSEVEQFLFNKMKPRGHVYIVSAYKKVVDGSFQVPFQGKWIHNIDSTKHPGEFDSYLNQTDTFNEYHS